MTSAAAPAIDQTAAADAEPLVTVSDFKPDRVREYMLERTRSVLFSRSTALSWSILIGIVAFSTAKFAFETSTPVAWYGPALALALLQIFLLGFVRKDMTTNWLENVLLGDAVAACVVIAWLGVVSGRTSGSEYFLMGLTVNTAALLPWRPRTQAALALTAMAAILGNGYGVHSSLFESADFRTLVPAVVLIGASVYTSRVLERSRLDFARGELFRERAEAESREFNAQLERRVHERTAELQAANGELEAFAYSVSHDLRAPLRAMDGLSEALMEDYSENLDNLGRDYLRRIRGESKRLGDLVDDLLRLSRVTRAIVRRTDVDLGVLAAAEFEKLRAANPDREVVVTVGENLVEGCDEYLVRIALENLLSNAYKFTRGQPRAHIEFGQEDRDGERVFVVRDNGAGFDMAHVSKVFEAFERLHGGDEFEGTGIGLTTVDRIVRRHGGWITAEAEPDRGATFRFTLRPRRNGNG